MIHGQMTKQELKEWEKERDKAFTEFVMNDDISAPLTFYLNSGIHIPKDIREFKAGIYKAVYACMSIPKEVKEVAAKKCIELGFKPTFET